VSSVNFDTVQEQNNMTSLWYICMPNATIQLVTVVARSKAWTVFVRLDAGIVCSNPTQGMDVLCVYAFILCLCCPVVRYRLCDGLITNPKSPTICEKWLRNWIRGQGPEWAGRAIEKKKPPFISAVCVLWNYKDYMNVRQAFKLHCEMSLFNFIIYNIYTSLSFNLSIKTTKNIYMDILNMSI
jgi:hypothetical protein